MLNNDSLEVLRAVFAPDNVKLCFPRCCYQASEEFLRLYGKEGDELIEGIYSEEGQDYKEFACDDFKDLETCVHCGGLQDICSLNRHYWIEREGKTIDLTAYQFANVFRVNYNGQDISDDILLLIAMGNREDLPSENYIPLNVDKKI